MNTLKQQIKSADYWWQMKNWYPQDRYIYRIWEEEEKKLDKLLSRRLARKGRLINDSTDKVAANIKNPKQKLRCVMFNRKDKY